MKYLFVHIPKTGGFGLSKSDELKNEIYHITARDMKSTEYVQQAKNTFDALGLNYQFGHCRWRDLHPNLQDKYKGKTAALIRNPWSRVVSQFLFSKKIAKESTTVNPTTVKQDATFEEFINMRLIWGKRPFFWQRTTVGWFPQKDYVTDENNNLKVDVLRFENYSEDTVDYFKLPKPLPFRNVSNGEIKDGKVIGKKDYKEFYTEKTKQIIADWYADDIEYFGFDFNTGATKNYWRV